MMQDKKIVHFVYSLGSGGAEHMLTSLVLNSHAFDYVVVCFSEPGFFSDLLLKKGIKTYHLYANNKRLYNLFKLFFIIKKEKPQIIQSWIYFPNLMALIVKLFFWKVKIIWCLRTSMLDRKLHPKLEIISNKICSNFSKIPSYIVGCGSLVRQNHIDIYHYYANNFLTIYNGCDTEKYYINEKLGSDFRLLHNIKAEDFVIGFVARNNPVKGISDFLESLSIIKKQDYHFKVLMAGSGNDQNNKNLVNEIDKYKLSSNIILLGEVENTVPLYNAMNLFVLASHAESFGNVMCEAMSCGVPVVATDVGEARNIVGTYGFIVETKNPHAMASAIIDIYQNQVNFNDKLSVRSRIINNYSKENMVRQYEELYFKVLG